MMSIPFHRENTSIFWVGFWVFLVGLLRCYFSLIVTRAYVSLWNERMIRLPCIINLSDSSSCRMHSFRSQVLLLDLLSYMLVCIYFQWKADRNLKLWKNISRYIQTSRYIYTLETSYWSRIVLLFFYLNFVISEFYADFKSFCNNRIKHVLIRFYVNEDMSIIWRLTKIFFL